MLSQCRHFGGSTQWVGGMENMNVQVRGVHRYMGQLLGKPRIPPGRSPEKGANTGIGACATEINNRASARATADSARWMELQMVRPLA